MRTMLKTTLSAAALLLLLATAALAQGNPVSDAVRGMVARDARNMVSAAELMPAEKYSYHPTEGQMTFGQLALHIARSNDFLCSKISGQAAPKGADLTATSPKADLVAALKDSFAFCHDALAGVTDAELGQPITMFGGRSSTKGAALVIIAADLADHYSQQADYLRQNGILPPTARRGRM